MYFKDDEKVEFTLKFINPICTTFIYFLLKDSEVVYVGQTRKGLQRTFLHTDKDFDEVKVIKCKTEELDILESYYISKYIPKYNKVIGKGNLLSVYKARNTLRKIKGFEKSTIPQLKKLLIKYKIEIITFNNIQYVKKDEYGKMLHTLTRK